MIKLKCWIFCSAFACASISAKLYADDQLVPQPPAAMSEQLSGELNAELSQLSNSLTLEVNKRGFALISELLTSEWASEWHDKALPDASFSVAPLAHVKAEGIKASVELDAIKLLPSDDGLRLDFTLKNLHVQVDTITLANYFIPALKTVCQNTEVRIGNHNPVPVYTHIGVSLDAEREVKLDLAGMDFTLERAHYKTHGPAYCVGALGSSDYLTRFVVRRVLSYARHKIAHMLTAKIEALVPRLAARLNEQLAQSVPVDVPDLYLIPGARLQFSVKPHSLHTDDEGLRLGLDIRVASDDTPSTADKNDPEEGGRSPFLAFASLGLNPELINHILTALFKNGSREMELPAAMHPRLAEVLNVSELNYFWPDLNTIQPDVEHLRLFLSLGEAPKLSLEQASQSMLLHVPALSLRFQVKLGGQWIDYFIIHQDLSLRMHAQLDAGALAMTFKDPQVRVSGEWAKNYTPIDPSFDTDLAAEIFTSMLQYGMGSISPLIFDIPAFAAGDNQFTIENFRIDDPFMKLDFVDQELDVNALGVSPSL